MIKTTLPLIGLLLTPLYEANAAIIYSSPGSTYSQDFDSLPNTPENTSIQATAPWVDDTSSPVGQTSILGWYLFHPIVQTEGGVNGNQRLRIGAGTANTGAFMSFGPSGSTDRALGSLASNTLAVAGAEMYLGLRLTNQTGVTLNQFTLSYFGEQWRDGGSATPNAQSLVFMWSTLATAISDPDTSFNIVPELGFTSPVVANTGSGVAVDGNDTSAGRVAISGVTVTGISWMPGTDLWLRWADTNNSGNDHGLAIDDLTFSAAVPEPASVGLIAVGALAMLRRRR
jgi:hypothetical protein